MTIKHSFLMQKKPHPWHSGASQCRVRASPEQPPKGLAGSAGHVGVSLLSPRTSTELSSTARVPGPRQPAARPSVPSQPAAFGKGRALFSGGTAVKATEISRINI